MNIYISTNMHSPENLMDIFKLLNNTKHKDIGIEIFPEWQSEVFIDVLRENIGRFKEYNISLHGPYYDTEHSAEKPTSEYMKAKQYFIETLKLSKELNSAYIVYHHNNCEILKEEKIKMIEVSSENLLELNNISREYNGNIVVENCGVISHNNMLLNEEEFIKMAESIPNNILIDVGHAFANKWDLKNVIFSLKDKIVSYHLHNNDGFYDCHDSIRNGKLNMEEFLEMYKEYTPEADLVIEYGKQCRNNMEIIEDDIDYIKNKLKGL